MMVESNKNHTRDTVVMGLFAVLIAVCSWITIPTFIPFTMQNFAVYLTLHVLGGRKGTVSVCIYLLLGAMGLPVFANFTSGIGVVIGPNGGYMMGWILSGIVLWGMEKLPVRKPWIRAVSMVIGLCICYGTGTAWFMMVYAKHTGSIGLGTALLWCVVPFIIPDLIKLGLALRIGGRLEKLIQCRE